MHNWAKLVFSSYIRRELVVLLATMRCTLQERFMIMMTFLYERHVGKPYRSDAQSVHKCSKLSQEKSGDVYHSSAHASQLSKACGPALPNSEFAPLDLHIVPR